MGYVWPIATAETGMPQEFEDAREVAAATRHKLVKAKYYASGEPTAAKLRQEIKAHADITERDTNWNERVFILINGITQLQAKEQDKLYDLCDDLFTGNKRRPAKATKSKGKKGKKSKGAEPETEPEAEPDDDAEPEAE